MAENKDLKIGVFNDAFAPVLDGVSWVAQNYATVFNSLGYDTTVVTANVPGADYKQFPFDVHTFASMPVVMRKPYRWGVPVGLMPWQDVMNDKYDIMHTHSPFTAAKIAIRLAKKNNTPFIASFHSKYKDDFIRVVKFDKIANMMIKNVIGVYEAADEVWVPQKSVIEVLREYGYKGKVEVVPNGVDYIVDQSVQAEAKIKARAKFGIKDGEHCLLYVGQITNEKNMHYMIDALSNLKNAPIKMFVIGVGYLEKEIKAKVETLGLNDKIVFVGPVREREVLQEYYSAANLFIFPSLYDTAPLVLREAAVHQTPTVLLSGSSSAEVVNHNVNGYLASKDDSKDFANVILNALADQPQLSSVSVEAAKTLGLTWREVVSGEVLDRYKALIARKNG